MRRFELRLLLGMLDAEIEIAPEEEDNRNFDAGFEPLNGIWSRDDKAADNESSKGTDEERPAECKQLEWEPVKRALQQRAANGAKGQAREEDADRHDQLITEEASKAPIPELPRLAEIRRDNKDGSDTKTTAAYGLEQPEGGVTHLGAVQHGQHFTLSRLVKGVSSSHEGFDLPQKLGGSRKACATKNGTK